MRAHSHPPHKEREREIAKRHLEKCTYMYAQEMYVSICDVYIYDEDTAQGRLWKEMNSKVKAMLRGKVDRFGKFSRDQELGVLGIESGHAP